MDFEGGAPAGVPQADSVTIRFMVASRWPLMPQDGRSKPKI